MKRFASFTAFTTALTLTAALLPAAVGAVTVSGKVTEPNFVTKKFWIQSGGKQIPVRGAGAAFSFRGRVANIYRLMGTPRVRVTGEMDGRFLDADSIVILTHPTARLQRSAYTDKARPRFTDEELVPR